MAHNSERKAACGFHTVVADPTPKRRKIHESMENTIIADDILHNILSRLSAKPLTRFRCASKQWNSLISDPYFFNSRSRRMIIISSRLRYLYALDDKHPNVIKLTYPFEDQISRSSVIGTVNGIVILVLQKPFLLPRIFILYNPLTRAAKKLPDPPNNNTCCLTPAVICAYGFGHGNIIIARASCRCISNNISYLDVFSLKNGSWTMPKTTFRCQRFLDKVGIYLNGYLHWINLYGNKLTIVALDVKEMVVTKMDGPPLNSDYYHLKSCVLGTLHGCLCIITKWRNGFDVWAMMKNEEQGVWSKQYSFALPFFRFLDNHFLDVCILEDGRIVVGDDVSNQVIICHVSERYYDIFECASKISRFDNCFEYVESLVSPSDICHF